jgi:hypothetical protein
MRRKPAKRWVHKDEYRDLVKQRIGYCAVAFLGILFIVGKCWIEMITSPSPPKVEHASAHLSTLSIIALVILMIVLILAEFGEALFGIYQSFRAAIKVESVHVITPRNHHNAPSKDCLVRASEISSSTQQAELLRAAQPGNKTPSEELLRAAVFHQEKP